MPNRYLQDEAVITDFLLGTASRAEREAVEARLVDVAYFDTVAALEDELIARFHQGELSRRERRLFERAYLSSPARRARVERARVLIEVITGGRRNVIRELRIWQRAGRWLESQRHPTQLAVAGAMLVIVVAVPALVYLNSDFRDRLARLQLENASSNSNVRPAALAVTATLLPGPYRGGGSVENRVRVPPGTEEVTLFVQLDDSVGIENLAATVLQVDTGRIEDAGPVEAIQGAGDATAAIHVVAGRLTAGDFVLSLFAKD